MYEYYLNLIKNSYYSKEEQKNDLCNIYVKRLNKCVSDNEMYMLYREIQER